MEYNVWHIGIISEIQFLLLLISGMQRKRFMHWCLSQAIFMEKMC